MAKLPPIKITVIECRALKLNTSKGTDPFVEVRIKGQTSFSITNVKEHTCDPYFDQKFEIQPDKESDLILLRVYDHNKKSKKHDLIGELELPVAKFKDKCVEEWYLWKKRKGSAMNDGQGEVHLKIEFGNPPPQSPQHFSPQSQQFVQQVPNNPLYSGGYMQPYVQPAYPYSVPMNPMYPYAQPPAYPYPTQAPPYMNVSKPSSPCPKCTRLNQSDAAFCSGCGNSLVIRCSTCNRTLQATSSFCDGCGTPVMKSGYHNNPGPSTADDSVQKLSQKIDNLNLGPFEIKYADLVFEKKVGKGSFGVVWKGKWRGGPVAIKKMRDAGLEQHELLDFQSEASVWCKLRPHSHVVQFLGITSNPLCIVTEFMDMGSLYRLLHSEEKIDINMTISYVKGIASGMLHLSSEGIIHRDLASRNVLLGAGNQVKICDFGLARLGSNQENKTNNPAGPLKWMAPESLEKRIYSVKTDVWAFAVTTWEIITRQDPYPGEEAVHVALKVVDPRNPLRLEIPAFAPPILRHVLSKCFMTEPEKRPDFKWINDVLQNSKMNEWIVGGQANTPNNAPQPLSPRGTPHKPPAPNPNLKNPPTQQRSSNQRGYTYDSMPDLPRLNQN